MTDDQARTAENRTNHTHICQTCQHEWDCFEPKPFKKCPTMVAARVNRQGPFCALCLHVEMARRYAANRKIDLQVNWP